MKKISCAAVSALVLLFSVSVSAKEKTKTQRNGNIETVEVKDGDELLYRLVYTYEGDKKVRGEYWEAPPKKKKDKAKPNIFTGTALAVKYEAQLKDANLSDDSGVNLDVEKDGMILKFVKIVRYDESGRVRFVMARGYTSYPVLGSFNIKTDYSYSYDGAGNIAEISEKNINVDSLLLKMGAGNTTKFTRDASGRVLKTVKSLGSIPPASETTDYVYVDAGPNMKTTVYRKCSFDTTSLKVIPSETITVEYGKNVPWNGTKKYGFIMEDVVDSFKIFDEALQKNKIDIKGFKKQGLMEKAKTAKSVYDLYKNEMKGPSWRMGDLPDAPEPFLVYKDNKWWE